MPGGGLPIIDIHCHILPELDDGAQTLDEACEMALLAVKSGVKVMAATPHCNIPGGFYNLFGADLVQRFTGLRETLAHRCVPLELVLGMEVFTADDVAEKLASGQVRPINAGRHILLEFALNDDPVRAGMVLEKVADMGYMPVVAHPERYLFLQADLDIAASWARKGYLLQLNKGSILGAFGARARTAADELLKSRLAHVIASDGHSPYRRTPELFSAYEYIGDRYGRAYANSLLIDVPGSIVYGK